MNKSIEVNGLSVLVFRIFLSGIFITAGITHFMHPDQITSRIPSAALHFFSLFSADPHLLGVLSGYALLIGGLAFLMGVFTRWSAMVLFLVLIPITITVQLGNGLFHGPLWKNVALFGGLIFFIINNPKGYSVFNNNIPKSIIAIFLALMTFGAGNLKAQTAENVRSIEETITILQTADIHAYLNVHEELFVENDSIVFRKAGGLAHIKTLTDSIRNENPDGTLLIDGGDFIQGSGASFRSQGRIFPPIVKAMNYDLLIPGNWEVIYGKQIMMEVMNSYNTQVIAANMKDEAKDISLFPPYWMTEKKGVKIGFIAYNDPEVPVRQNPEFSKGIIFTKVEKNLVALIDQLKETEKVDLLFLVTHLGISKQLMLANNPAVKGVDFILGNDTHERIRIPIEGKYAKVVEPGAFGSFVGRLDLKIKDKKLVSYTYDLIEVSPGKYKADKKVQQIVDDANFPYQKEMQTVLGYTSTPMYRYLVVENPMDNLITDALLWKTGVDFATSNGFRFGVPIVPDSSGRAVITKGDLWRMLPVDEQMKIGKVSGQQIQDWLEKEINNVYASNYEDRFGGWLVRFSGLTLKFNSSRTNGNRIESIIIKGKPLDLKKMYTMASCNRTGEPLSTLCRMKNASDVKMLDYTLHNAVEDYLKAKGTVSPHLDGRSIATDLGTNAFSQMKEGDYQFL